MHNIKLIRKDPDFFLKKLRHRNSNINLKNILDLDKKNRELIQSKEKLEQEKKIISKTKDKSQFVKSKEISKKIDQFDQSQIKIKKEIENALNSLPNLALEDVPSGKDEKSFMINKQAYTGEGKIINSKFLNGLKAPNESIVKTISILEKKRLGKKKINFRLKDWGISRQRYWGCPIPILYKKNGEIVALPEDQLPVLLPDDIDFAIIKSGATPNP